MAEWLRSKALKGRNMLSPFQGSSLLSGFPVPGLAAWAIN
jgi:hypothetical protein